MGQTRLDTGRFEGRRAEEEEKLQAVKPISLVVRGICVARVVLIHQAEA
jgi:hypothetical protein